MYSSKLVANIQGKTKDKYIQGRAVNKSYVIKCWGFYLDSDVLLVHGLQPLFAPRKYVNYSELRLNSITISKCYTCRGLSKCNYITASPIDLPGWTPSRCVAFRIIYMSSNNRKVWNSTGICFVFRLQFLARVIRFFLYRVANTYEVL